MDTIIALIAVANVVIAAKEWLMTTQLMLEITETYAIVAWSQEIMMSALNAANG